MSSGRTELFHSTEQFGGNYMTTVLFDSNVYDRLENDKGARSAIENLSSLGKIRVIATPRVQDELASSPFGGLPEWFPVTVEPESVFVLDFARLGMERLGDGRVFNEHRGASNQASDAVIADSADDLADIFVSEDRRASTRLNSASERCVGMSYLDFRAWLRSQMSRSRQNCDSLV